MKYILKGKVPVPCEDTLEWAEWFQKNKRTLKKTKIASSLISTVFLGIDHDFTGLGPPVLFETMIFGGPEDGYQTRYRNYFEAMIGHNEAVHMVQSKQCTLLGWILRPYWRITDYLKQLHKKWLMRQMRKYYGKRIQ